MCSIRQKQKLLDSASTVKNNTGVIQHDFCFQFSSVQSLSCTQLFVNPWTAARQASLSITNSPTPRAYTNSCPSESVMPSNHLILCHPLSSCPQSFPASGSFQMSQLFASGGQNIGISSSTSVLSINTQD